MNLQQQLLLLLCHPSVHGWLVGSCLCGWKGLVHPWSWKWPADAAQQGPAACAGSYQLHAELAVNTCYVSICGLQEGAVNGMMRVVWLEMHIPTQRLLVKAEMVLNSLGIDGKY